MWPFLSVLSPVASCLPGESGLYHCSPHLNFLPLGNVPLYGCNHILLIHPPVDGHFSFCFETILNNAARKLCAWDSAWTYIFISFDYILRSGILGSLARSTGKVLRNCLFSKVAVLLSTCMRILSCFLSLVSLTPSRNQIFWVLNIKLIKSLLSWTRLE